MKRYKLLEILANWPEHVVVTVYRDGSARTITLDQATDAEYMELLSTWFSGLEPGE